MSWAEVFVTVIKILIVIMFLLNLAAVSIWADRRQSAMVQDRVGPNRAVVHLPHLAAVGLMLAPAILIAAAISIPFWHPAPGIELARITTGLEIAIGVGWFSLMLLCAHVRKHGADNGFEAALAQQDPRAYFYGGLVLHMAALPLARVIPSEYYQVELPLFEHTVQLGAGMAGAIAAMTIMFAGFYASSKLPLGKVPLRLAGLLHAIADAVKLVWKEDLRPKRADKLLFNLAPFLAMFPALVTIAVVPFGGTMCVRDADRDGGLSFGDLTELANTVSRTGECAAGEIAIQLQVADLNVGLLYVFAIAGTGIIGAAIAGWASDNKFALLGGLRATSQMISYEVAMGLAIVPILMIVGSVRMRELVDWQGENTWGIFVQPIAFILFLTALVAETKRVPFDQPEGESEIVAGYFLEYSGMKFGLFFVGEYAEFVFSSALLVTLFFGGYHLPFVYADGIHIAFGDLAVYDLKMSHMAVTIIGMLGFFGKTLFVWFLQVFIRWTLPRFRYDQVMKLGWTKLLPLALANIMLTGVVVLAIDAGGKGTSDVLALLAQISQAVIAVGALLGAVGAVTWMLEPPKVKRLVQSTSARFAAAAGGVKAGEMQA
jgi:NADH-quinone oxidoreductase subunit H